MAWRGGGNKLEVLVHIGEEVVIKVVKPMFGNGKKIEGEVIK